MIDFFYSLPIWLATILILGVALAIGLCSSLGLRALFRLQPTDQEREAAVSLMQVVAAYIGIMIAFAGVVVWQGFAEAQNAVHREAGSAAQLYRDLTTYGPETLAARNDLRAYVASIVNDEWPLLGQGKTSNSTDIALTRLFEEIGTIRPKDDRDSAIYSESFTNLNELVALRRDRLIHSQSGIPLILWMVGLVGSVLIVSYASTFPPTRINVMMIAGVSVTLGLIFLFILIVDQPYKGKFSVSSRELSELSHKFDMLDRLSRSRLKATVAEAGVD